MHVSTVRLKPIEINLPTPIRPSCLNVAVRLLGDAFVTTGKSWCLMAAGKTKGLNLNLCTGTHLTTRTATTINCGWEVALRSQSCWQDFSRIIHWLPKNVSVSKLQSNK